VVLVACLEGSTQVPRQDRYKIIHRVIFIHF